jgi:pyridinium-3,5-biscarboxylic acid mononucleotide synthase
MTDKPERPSEIVFADLRAALDAEDSLQSNPDVARLDFRRRERTGAPEILLASGKQSQQVIELARSMVNRVERVLISRVSQELAQSLRSEFDGNDHTVVYRARASMVRIAKSGSRIERTGGSVVIFTAGTSDLPLAEEAGLVIDEMGCDVQIVADVGVAGLHRVIAPLRDALDRDVDVIIVVAGMDGALPSVIAGLSPVPVIGLPSSVGYGFGGRGEAALMSMLQTCSPGLTVVNIDNSVGAAIAAATIANGIAAARSTRR